MTGAEKIKQDMASTTRNEKMEEIRDQICDWDHDALVDYVQFRVEGDLSPMSLSDFEDEYYEWVSHKYESGDYEDDEEEVQAVATEETCEICNNEKKDVGMKCWRCGN